MADTANERIRDALIRHQVGLQMAGFAVSDEAIRILDRVEAEIAREIRDALEAGATISTSRGLRRLRFMEDAIDGIREAAWGRVDDLLERRMGELARHEAEFAATLIEGEIPVAFDMELPDPSTLVALAGTKAFEGGTLGRWLQRMSEVDRRRLVDAVRTGMTRGLSNQDIVRQVVGSSVLDGKDGITQMTRNQVESLVRTATNAISNEARSLTFQENKALIEREMYVATLDSRTTPRCRSLDGKVYPVGDGPHPPQHFGCRSIRVALIGGEAIGTRPLKASTERQLVREFGEKEGFSVRRRDEIPRGLRGKFDEYARRRVRELTGTAPAHLTYEQFLRRQSREFQEEVLGKARALLFREGKLKLDRFVTRGGKQITLADLVKRERAAFVRAGLDPRKYSA